MLTKLLLRFALVQVELANREVCEVELFEVDLYGLSLVNVELSKVELLRVKLANVELVMALGPVCVVFNGVRLRCEVDVFHAPSRAAVESGVAGKGCPPLCVAVPIKRPFEECSKSPK